MIEKLLTLENIDVNVNVENWKDAISKAGNILLKNNKIEERYIQSMIDNVENLGAYIVMCDGVAMPHSRPEAGAKDLGISVITLKTPVSFGNEEFDPVSVVFAICSNDNNEHLNLLKDLSCILDDETMVERAKNCNTKEELLSLLISLIEENK